MKQLYVIGNGFDIHHDIPSRYSDYREWLEENDAELIENLRNYYDVDDKDWWNQFELELVAYLFVGEITEKRKAVDELLEATLDEKQVQDVSQEFERILDVLCVMNRDVAPMNDTRFKQRNDFYTLFAYVAKHKEIPLPVLKEQYRFVVFLDKKGYIRPTNEECDTLKEYAYHCVTQSNSKHAREQRLLILEDILLCLEGDEKSDRLSDVCEYLEGELEIDSIPFIRMSGYEVVDTAKLV